MKEEEEKNNRDRMQGTTRSNARDGGCNTHNNVRGGFFGLVQGWGLGFF